MNKSQKNTAFHAAAWILFLLYEWIFKQGILTNPQTSLFHLKIVVIRIAALIPAVYFTTEYLVPKLFFNGRKAWFVVALIDTITADTFLMKTMNYFFALKGVTGFATSYIDSLCNLTGWLVFMGNIAFNVSFVLMIFFINRWLQDDRKRQALEAAKKDAELQLLKSQVQPHFLFNTINNIYALSKKGSPATTEMIYRLSGLLEYMLYDSSREWISLEQELRYIKNYLEIEKIRYGSRLDVAFATYGDRQGVEVPSLILLPFVENAFKHGLSHQTANCWLRIEVGYNNQQLSLKVENSKPEKVLTLAAKGGIGITNVRKRLKILLDDDFDIKQLDGADSYLVTLTFQPKLANHEKSRREVAMPGG